jgi:hypothetical protein
VEKGMASTRKLPFSAPLKRTCLAVCEDLANERKKLMNKEQKWKERGYKLKEEVF